MLLYDCSTFGWDIMKKTLFLFLTLMIFLSNIAYADDAILEWDENNDADYYVVYWSTDSDFSEGDSMVIPGDMSFLELEDSSDGQEYYYTVRAFNACGNTSDFSDSIKTAHLPAEGSFGSVIEVDTKSFSPIAGVEAESGGCFIGSTM